MVQSSVAPANQQAQAALRIRQDPLRFVRDVLDEELLGKQREILEALRDHQAVFVRSCHDSGKSFVAARAVLWFLMAHPNDAIVISTAPTHRQVEEVLWREIAVAYGKAKVSLGGRLLTTRLDLGPKWFALGMATDQPVNFQGFHASNVLVVIDEADAVPAATWTALDSVLTSGNAKVLAIGNPLDPASEFRRRHNSAIGKPGAKCIKISADDVLALSDTGRYEFLLKRSWVEDVRQQWGETSALYLGKVLAEWPDQGSDTLIPVSWIERAKGRAVQRGLRAMGVDVARFGSARTVRTLVEGNWLVFSRATAKEDTMQTAGRTFADINEYAPVSIAVDDTGVGGAVTDRLRQLGKSIMPVNFGGKAYDEQRFVNRGSEIYWLTRQAFEHDLIGFSMDDPEAIDELITDLNRPRYDTDERGRIRVDKLGMGRGHTEASLSDQERIARSPDRGDSFVMAYSVAGVYTGGPFAERPKGIVELELERLGWGPHGRIDHDNGQGWWS
jgi:hypothetical protein